MQWIVQMQDVKYLSVVSYIPSSIIEVETPLAQFCQLYASLSMVPAALCIPWYGFWIYVITAAIAI